MNTVDDRSSAWSYRGAWTTSSENAPEEFQGTTTWTQDITTAVLTFTGVQVSIFGVIAPNGTGIAPESSYIIDNGSATTFSAVQTSDKQFKQLFFESGALGPTEHTLIVKNLKSHGRLFLDFASIITIASTTNGATPTTTSLSNSSTTLELAPITKHPNAASTSTTSHTTITPSGGGLSQVRTTATLETIFPTALKTSTQFISVTTSTDRPSHISPSEITAIFGGGIGGLLLIGFAIICAILLRNRQNAQYRRSDAMAIPNSHVTPFTLQLSNEQNLSKSEALVGQNDEGTSVQQHQPSPCILPPGYE
ncbi:hypothetical protein HYPSUDRAFT_919771 [Hypholoma sublateritium FD-334 SS-4]|uniref:Transmembrane protein n=1 Tax=Hypholoma sublateritium (strain FD-334 SS-4) TaxID=945553 RepID=A0A0D2NPH9_HYPSF|nr:hypothetical protein HYPSUDRAFT_919771 [Hypholoma sublateritium FD-334 SS-4]